MKGNKNLTVYLIILFLVFIRFDIKAIEQLHKDGKNYKNNQNEVVKFWGVNIVAFYPDHQTAINFAENLASRGINLVRWHHMMLDGSDWNWKSGIKGLVTFNGDTRTPDNEAWDNFDFLNAELEKRGIYIMIAGEWSRTYLPGDVDILTTNDQDRSDWMAAMSTLNDSLNYYNPETNDAGWSRWIDKLKMLVTFDERCALLNEEAIERLLEHQNPYMNNIKYKDSPQVLTFEVINEFSSEYTIYMGNHYDGYNAQLNYWDDELQNKFSEYCNDNNVTPFNLYNPSTDLQYRTRSDFLIKLDRDYFTRIKNLISSHNPSNNMTITYSTVWRDERSGELHYTDAEHTEDHIYEDPYVVNKKEDFIYHLASFLAQNDKPYFVGEINMNESDYTTMRQNRTMMYFAFSVYGSLHDWSGVTWFAWNHGDRYVGSDGWGEYEAQEPSDEYLIGDILQDAMVVDHFRTLGKIFTEKMVSVSIEPKEFWVEDSYQPYYSPGWPVPPIESFQPGWQNISSIRKGYGPKPPGQDTEPFMSQDPPTLLNSDTDEITKDIEREQLTFSVSKAEGFSGKLDNNLPANLRILRFSQTSGFATVVLVADDNNQLENSESLILSRTYMQNNTDTDGPAITLKNLKQENATYKWHIKYTRPRNLNNGTFTQINMDANGNLALPNTNWRECELAYLEVGGTVLPNAPTDLNAVATSTSQIDLSWQDNSSNEDGFKIERSGNGGTSYTQIATVAADVTNYSDGGLAVNTTYYYRVRAYNTSGNSDYSNVANATTHSADNSNCKIVKTATPPNIDTIIDELWADAITYPINNLLLGNVSSDADLSGKWRAMWDDNNLYYLVEIKDDAEGFGSEQVYDDDAVELFIDADNSKETSYDGVNDFHYLFRYTEGVVHFGNNSVQNSNGIAFGISRLNDGYVFEASIPWTTLGVTPSEGNFIGTEVEIDDDDTDDGGPRDAKKAWLATTDDCWQNPSLFGNAKLLGLGVLLQTKIFLEGAYNGNSEMSTALNNSIPKTSPYAEDPRTVESVPADVVDWVLVQLREGTNTQAVVSKSAFLLKNGRIVTDDATSNEIRLPAPEGDYYIVIKHRNHIAVMSANKIHLSPATSTLYDFTTGSNKFYGSGGAKQIE